MALGAAGLIIALFVCWLALNRWAPGSIRIRSRRSNLLEVTARLALDPRKHVYVVKAAGEYVLLGTSESGVQLLKVLDADAVVREIESQNCTQSVPPSRSFLAALKEAATPGDRRPA